MIVHPLLSLGLIFCSSTVISAESVRSNDFSTILVLEDSAPHLGDAIRVSLKVKNNTNHDLSTDKSATAFDCFEVTGPDGQVAAYVGFMGQVMSNPTNLPPGVSLILAEHLDLTDKYVLEKPAKYSVRFKGAVSGLPDSNTLTFDVAPGQLTELDQAVIRLLSIRPKGWYVTKSPRTQHEVTPFGRSPAAGYDAHICRNYMRGEAVYLWLTKVPTETDPKQNPPLMSDYLGRAHGLYFYVAIASATPALWSNALEDITRVLQIAKDRVH
jgi:hypothetical protein